MANQVATASIVGSSSVTAQDTRGLPAIATIGATSSVSVSAILGDIAQIIASSSVSASATVARNFPISATIKGSSSLSASARYGQTVEIDGLATVSAAAKATHPVATTITAASSFTASAVLGDVVSFEGFATVAAAVTLAHSARASIVASSSVTVTAQGTTYFAVATGATRVRCIFGVDESGHLQTFPMMVNVALTNPSSYTLSDFNGNVIPITNVQTEQAPPGSVYSVVLTLSTPLATDQWYLTTLSAGILDSSGQPLEVLTSTFQWVLPTQTTTVPLWEFSEPPPMPGLPQPPGVVFFSPSLNVAAPNSIIQVEDVSVCTTAYDQYHFPPQIIDPSPFFVWGPPSPTTTLGEPGIVLFAEFPFLSEASFTLGFGFPSPAAPLQEEMPQAFDSSCSIVLRQPFAPGYVALLNNLAYWLFDGIPADETTPPMFICAENGGPIPPGSDEIIVIHQAIVGYATMTVQEPSVIHWAQVNIHGDSSLATSPLLSPTAIKANSIMRVARPHLSLGATVNMAGQARVTVQTIGGQDLEATADIVGYALLDAHVEMKWPATTAIEATSSIFTRASRHRKIAATALGNSVLSGFATKGPIGAAAIHAGSSMAAHATVDHPVRATISGTSALNAAAT